MKRLITGILALLLASCGGGSFDDLENFVETAGNDMRGKIPPPPEVEHYEPFFYDNSENLPDPFKPREKDKDERLDAPQRTWVKEALEEFTLSSLNMVGYLHQDGRSYAVIRAPDGKLHRVTAGNHLGQDFGEIIEIHETEVIINETVQNSAGDWVERLSSLQLLE